MRRGLSIFLVLYIWLGPLAAALPGSEDARLPPCCRRHGAHHCSLSLRMAARRAAAASGKPAFNAPSTCPLFPANGAACAAPVHALAAAPALFAASPAQPHAPGSGPAAARLGPIRTCASRGPPAIALG